LCESAPDDVLGWVLTHERSHLERRDAWSGLLVGLGRAVFFFLPWYGWLRRRVRLCQEYLADAAAVATGRAEDYAEFLLGWAAAPPTPAGAAGVFGHSSDLYRRITMLLQNPVPVERRCPARWSLIAGLGLLAAAVIAAGIGLKAYAAPVPKKDAPAKEEPKKDEPKKDDKAKPQQPGLILPNLPPGVILPPNFEGVFKNFQPGALRQTPEEIRKRIEEIQKQQQKTMEEINRLLQQQQGVLGRMRGAGGVRGRFGGFGGVMHEGRLGAMVDVPSATLVEQLDLPKDQGVVVEEVTPDSAAAKAGLKPHDILLELNGKAVPSKIDDFLKQLDDIKANTPVNAVVMRKGKKETVKGISLPEAKEVPGFPFNRNRFQMFQGFPAGGMKGGFALGGFPGGKGVSMTVTRDNDQVSAHLREEGLAISLTGKVEDGKVKVGEISVQDGAGQKYDSLEKVPEKYRDKVKKLIEAAEKGTVRVEKN
jgi:membrane-associated protease RseP (regulator of RpoE activity)